MNLQNRLKRAVARAASKEVQSGQIVGLGSGSTAALLIEDVGARMRSGELTGVRAVPTSFQAELLAQQHGIPLVALNDVDQIDIAIDGADEVDPQRNLIKGGGACHTREKLVDARADRFVVIVDESKLSPALGTNFAVPVEVLPQAYKQVSRALEALGGRPDLRMAVRKAGPVVTDQGNLVLDTTFEPITNPAQLEEEINNIPGVLENGLFVGVVDEVLVGSIRDAKAVVTPLG